VWIVPPGVPEVLRVRMRLEFSEDAALLEILESLDAEFEE
jgi:hypothetical protein